MYQLTNNPDVILDTTTNTSIPRGHRLWAEYEAWVAAGNTATYPPQTFDSIMASMLPALQQWMDNTAQQNGYDNVVSCTTYKDSGVAQWRADAEAMIAWRDALWQAAYAWRDSLNGQLPNPIPTLEEVIAQLPQASTYGWTNHGGAPGQETPPPLEEV